MNSQIQWCLSIDPWSRLVFVCLAGGSWMSVSTGNSTCVLEQAFKLQQSGRVKTCRWPCLRLARCGTAAVQSSSTIREMATNTLSKSRMLWITKNALHNADCGHEIMMGPQSLGWRAFNVFWDVYMLYWKYICAWQLHLKRIFLIGPEQWSNVICKWPCFSEGSIVFDQLLIYCFALFPWKVQLLKHDVLFTKFGRTTFSTSALFLGQFPSSELSPQTACLYPDCI